MPHNANGNGFSRKIKSILDKPNVGSNSFLKDKGLPDLSLGNKMMFQRKSFQRQRIPNLKLANKNVFQKKSIPAFGHGNFQK